MRTALLLLGLCLLLTVPAATADVRVEVDVGAHHLEYTGPTDCPLGPFVIGGNPYVNGGGGGGNCALSVTV